MATLLVSSALLVGLVALPLLALVIDLSLAPAAELLARHQGDVVPAAVEDFTVLVPIYGDVAYLENIDYLQAYGSKVTLCTTDAETPEFYRSLRSIAHDHEFKVFVASHETRPAATGRRQTGGITRDLVIREALREVASEFVVCIDADTRTEQPLQEIVGALAGQGLDLASVRLVVVNRSGLLARLQAHEYRMSMRLRRLMPWLCSGACHLGRTSAVRDVMDRHSLFFQGNDAELGLIAHELGFTIGHLPFGVPTTVPDRTRAWTRQRFAWAGGEFRLYVVNARLVRQHPWFILYGALLVFALAPFRLASAVHPGLVLFGVVAAYWLVVMAANRRHFDLALLVYPLYGLFNSLVMAPLGLFSYLHMALQSRNLGIIRSTPAPVHKAPAQIA